MGRRFPGRGLFNTSRVFPSRCLRGRSEFRQRPQAPESELNKLRIGIATMNLNLLLARTFQFVTFVFFTFTALVYVGLLLVLPLDILTQLIRLLMGIGFPVVLAAGLGIAALGYLGYAVSRMPELYTLMYEIGRELILFSHRQIKRFDPLIAVAKGAVDGDQATA